MNQATKKPTIALIGGGAANLAAAYHLGQQFNIHLYEQGKTVGRKFLVAGNGGFNLTNGAKLPELLNVYSADAPLQTALTDFDTTATRKWLESMGISTFVGSSNRVFPTKGIKPATVLSKLKKKLVDDGVIIHTKAKFVGFSPTHQPLIETTEGINEITADHTIFALGGGSWKKTGSNDEWMPHFNQLNIETLPFEPSNCGVQVNWEAGFAEKFAGTPLKNCQFKVGDFVQNGEAVITEYGLEGNAVYPISSKVRAHLKKGEHVDLLIDFKPNNTAESLVAKVHPATQTKQYKYLLNLTALQQQLVKRTMAKKDYLNPAAFAQQLKKVKIAVVALRPVDEAISTVGGISMDEIQTDFSLKKAPHLSVIGEMLNWDAPTGGFLLQGCFASGVKAATALKEKYNHPTI